MDNRPIGVFDSGVGGLTAMRQLIRLLPGERFVYFGDTGRVPYGGRSTETLIQYARQDVVFLRSFDPKAIVVACGTVSTVALSLLAEELPLPILGVVEPAARAAAERTKNGRVGVVGTKATIRSGAYERAIRGLTPGIEIVSRACPLLVPLVEKGHDCKQMQGLALKNVDLRLVNQKKKVVFQEFGELLFTHFGLSGPVVLSASAHMNEKDSYTAVIDLKPALDEGKLDQRLLRDFEKFQNRDFENALVELLPKSVIPVVIRRSGIPPEEKVHSITREQRRALLETIKHFAVEIACKAPVEDAIVTSGGVKVSEVDPKTMQSKKMRGLYFAGELLDVDAYTGGFNLQIAWATGKAAGEAAAEYLTER